ncbi:hypothetical protein FQR65_LT09453 [Abscondita terminalis]|nr:hypothetical protein FQR65_LT09453 [Abscondita terminalis]
MTQIPFERYLDTKNHDWPQVFTLFVVGLSAFTCSALMIWPSPTIPKLLSNTSHISNVTFEETSYFTVIPPISTLIAAPFVSYLLDTIGRKKAIMLAIIPHITSWLLVAFSDRMLFLYLSRLIFGISDSVLFCIPTYVGEIATPKVRGSWGNLLPIGLFFSGFVVNVVGSFNTIRTTALILVVVPIVHAIFITIAPESPYYLVMKGKMSEAEKSLKWLRWNKNVQEEFDIICHDVARQQSEKGRMKDVWIIPTNRRALLIILALRISQQLSGFVAFFTYTHYIFAAAGGHLSASSSAIIYTAVLFVLSVICSFTVDIFGRRPSMMFSTVGCTIALFIEATYFYLLERIHLNLTDFNWVPLAGLLLYTISCIPGLGILPTLMLGELFSSSIKSKAAGLHIIVYSLLTLSVPKIFQYLSVHYGISPSINVGIIPNPGTPDMTYTIKPTSGIQFKSAKLMFVSFIKEKYTLSANNASVQPIIENIIKGLRPNVLIV